MIAYFKVSPVLFWNVLRMRKFYFEKDELVNIKDSRSFFKSIN